MLRLEFSGTRATKMNVNSIGGKEKEKDRGSYIIIQVVIVSLGNINSTYLPYSVHYTW